MIPLLCYALGCVSTGLAVLVVLFARGLTITPRAHRERRPPSMRGMIPQIPCGPDTRHSNCTTPGCGKGKAP